MNKELFCSFIADTRRESKLTQRELADKLHVTDKAVSKWERGLCYPDLTLMEDLAATLGLTMTELMACQREKSEESSDVNQELAVRSVLDISGEVIKANRMSIWKYLFLAALLILIVGGVFYYSCLVSETRQSSVYMKQVEDSTYYIYLIEDNHLLRLACPDKEIYDAIELDKSLRYDIQCRWNRLTYRGDLSSCMLNDSVIGLGGMMDQVGSAVDAGELFGRPCVWQKYVDIYPDPNRKHSFLFTYRYYIVGDGSEYFLDEPETTLLTVEDCRKTSPYDYDDDGITELFVLTRFDEEPYMLYDQENGEITARFIDADEVPADVLEWFQKAW